MAVSSKLSLVISEAEINSRMHFVDHCLFVNLFLVCVCVCVCVCVLLQDTFFCQNSFACL